MIDSLTLDQMRVLVAVADAGSFSAAARKVGRVQSAISQSIQTLETTLGLVLFDRSGKTPRLTDAGKALVSDSRALTISLCAAWTAPIPASVRARTRCRPNMRGYSLTRRDARRNSVNAASAWPSRSKRSPNPQAVRARNASR